MPVRPDAPLRKVTLNLYEADCQTLERAFGHGWTTNVREHVCKLANEFRERPRTLGDLADDYIARFKQGTLDD